MKCLLIIVLHTSTQWIKHAWLCVCFFDRVYVGQSLISGAGEGLFAKIDTDADAVMAFYSGVRITHAEVCSSGILYQRRTFRTSKCALLGKI